jgi:NMD protein affecting ribosome stability and mRNA decay
MTIKCPFCGRKAHVVDDLISICMSCFKRWETVYTEKLRQKFNPKGEYDADE